MSVIEFFTSLPSKNSILEKHCSKLSHHEEFMRYKSNRFLISFVGKPCEFFQKIPNVLEAISKFCDRIKAKAKNDTF